MSEKQDTHGAPGEDAAKIHAMTVIPDANWVADAPEGFDRRLFGELVN